ncbi:MAG TPA: hypothetical protein VJ760_05270 [Nitrospiraceae bacterium]|nr:hypothetical protein [Nitrospiraceae bacterium]
MIHAISGGGIDKLIDIADFDQNTWLPTIFDPGTSMILIEPLPRAPVRRIQMHEHLIPSHEACRWMKENGQLNLNR